MEVEKIKQYVSRAYETAKLHGFHDEHKSNDHYVCLIISELMEAVEADRKEHRADMYGFTQKVKIHPDFAERYEYYIKGSVEEEFADVAIRIFDLIGLLYGDKMAYSGFEIGPEPYKTFTEKAWFFVYDVLGDTRTELYDSLYYMYEWAKQLDFDLDWHIRQKMAFNEHRERLHGKKY